jgi:hypothetical protein
MAIKEAIAALEKRLATAFPTTAISYENVKFDPPDNANWLAVQTTIGKPDDPVFGAKYRRENLTFQVFVFGLLNKGTGAALDLAQDIRDLYERGTYIGVGNLRIQCFQSPQISGSMIVNNRVVVPVLIPVTVEVYN